ncbi:pentatricopeptide repeat protein [Aspergillus ibericus CBS 121593]|uniref:Pentatricopeptide repeat protein n=1 Tax=Aspergillus ibericus CBS 121593 TaxID=1448316 RepID=A0A395H254_9EURO|nr:pentatricopeptide repeat protein [Aspergillus ibericus CBS 121593]RAL00284.1 pentatricopeptide repeat protein [Aspergillus ibericus CBS 121593]
MLVRPPRFLRSRVGAGLPSCVPQHRLRLGRRRGAQDTAPFGDNAPLSNTSSSAELDAARGDLKQPNARYAITPENNRQHPSNILSAYGLTVGRSAGNGLLRGQHLMSRRPFSPLSLGAGVRHLSSSSVSDNHTAVPAVQSDWAHARGLPEPVNRSISSSFTFERPLKKLPYNWTVKAQDDHVRSRQYNYPGRGIREWRLANRELYQARWDGREMKEEFVQYRLDDTDKQLLKGLEHDSWKTFMEQWTSLPYRERAIRWERLSLWLLWNSPVLTLEFLLVTCHPSRKYRPVFAMVADCLIYLNDLHRAEVERWTNGIHDFRAVISRCLRHTQWPLAYVPQRGVRLYIRTVDQIFVYKAWKSVCYSGHKLKGETFLAFMARFTEFGDIDNAIRALELARRSFRHLQIDPMNVMVSRHCSKLLTLDSVEDTESGERNFRILPTLLKMGIRPDRDMMNVVLSNALKTGDPHLGVDMLRYMKAEGFELDSYTYLALLHDAVTRLDQERLAHLIEELAARPELKKSPYIASKLMHAHFVFNVKSLDTAANRRELFYSLLNMYHELHDITPLKDLSIVPYEYHLSASGEKTPPSAIALYLMIATWLRCQTQVANVDRVYSKFRELVKQGHTDVAPLATTDHVYNEFMLAYRKNPHGLRPACRVMEDMLHSANTGSSEATITHTLPTVRTWTLLLSAFIFNNQPLAAERVKEMMANHGVEYDMSTWNVIISGLAAQQDTAGIAQSIKELEAQGFAVDAYTMKALGYLRDPEQLWTAMEKMDLKPMSLTPEDPLQPAPTHLPPNETDEEQPTPSSILLDELEDEQLLDRGLQRLKANA